MRHRRDGARLQREAAAFHPSGGSNRAHNREDQVFPASLVSPYMRPGSIYLHDSLPRIAGGKIDIGVLRQSAQQETSADVLANLRHGRTGVDADLLECFIGILRHAVTCDLNVLTANRILASM